MPQSAEKTKGIRLKGYDYVPSTSWSGSERPAYQPTPIYQDTHGNSFAALASDDGVTALPFIPGSPADLSEGAIPKRGGFVPIEKMPQMPPSGMPIGMTPGFNPNAPSAMAGGPATGHSEPAFEDMLAGMMSQMGPKMATDWLGQAAAKSIVAGGCTGVMDSALNVLGVGNPLASGPLAGVLDAALGKAGVGELGSLMPGVGTALMGGSTAGLANAMGRQGVNSLLTAAGLSDIPGASFVANALGNEIGEQLQDTFTGGLDSLTSDLSNSLGDLSVDGIVADAQSAIDNIDVNAIGSQGLDMAADQLMNEWQVDDESSAAEHIAQRAIKENMGELKSLAKDELLGGKGGGIAGLKAKIAKFFEGEAPGACLPVIRMGDMDDGADLSLMGVANILVEKQPVSRITDMVAGPKAPPPGKPILEGAATVLSAELPTAFVSSEVAVPSIMVKGAATVFLGGAIASISPPKPKAPPAAKSNDGPAGPKGPASTSSRSESEGAGKDGDISSTPHEDSSKGNAAEAVNPSTSSESQTPASGAVDHPESLEDLLGTPQDNGDGKSCSIEDFAKTTSPLAEDAYADWDPGNPSSSLPPGFDAELIYRHEGKDGYQAAIYKGDFEGEERVFIAHRGTEVSKSDLKESWRDLSTDAAQAFWMTSQQEQAVEFGKGVQEMFPGETIIHTGHSLGGGLAGLSSAMNDGVAAVYNSMGPQPPSIAAIQGAAKGANVENIVGFQTDGDPLTNLSTPATYAAGALLSPALAGYAWMTGVRAPGDPWGPHQYKIPSGTGHSISEQNSAIQSGQSMHFTGEDYPSYAPPPPRPPQVSGGSAAFDPYAYKPFRPAI